jgi:hypothetical protein
MLGQTTVTRDEAVARIKAMLSDSTDNFYTPTEVLYWLKDSLARLSRDLPIKYLPGLQRSYVTDTTLGQNGVDLSVAEPTVFRIRQVLMTFPAANGYPSVPVPCVQMGPEERAGLGTDSRLRSTATPPKWDSDEDKVYFYSYADDIAVPFPVRSVTVQYIQEIDWPMASDAPLPVSDDMVESVVYLAAKQGFIKANDLAHAAAMEQGYQMAIAAAGITIAREGTGV